MNVLHILLLIQGLILSFLLFTRNHNKVQNRMLGCFILVISIFSGIDVFVNLFPGINPEYVLIPFSCSKLLEPLTLFLYALALVRPNFTVPKKSVLGIIALGIALGTWSIVQGEWNSFEVFQDSIHATVVSVISLLLWAYCLPKGYKMILRARKENQVTSHYLSLLRVLFLIVLVSITLEILDDVNDYFLLYRNLELFDFVDLLFLATIYYISYKVLSQPQMFQDVESLLPKAEPAPKYSGSTLTEERLKGIQEKFEKLIQEEKPYLNGELTIQELANQLQVSRQYLTQVLNERLKCNFNDYINRLRVEEFKRRLQDSRYDNYTILALALDSGFNSKTTFNTIFKKYTGQTPSQYRKELTLNREG